MNLDSIEKIDVNRQISSRFTNRYVAMTQKLERTKLSRFLALLS